MPLRDDKRRALIFDCDGVLADTELHGHLVAFNEMWSKLGVPWRWSSGQYGEKLKIGGGKERIASLFDDAEFQRKVGPPEDEAERKTLIATWHKEKTAIYKEIVRSGRVSPRPGVKRLAREAISAGWRLAVASTSASDSVAAVLSCVMEELAPEFLNVSGDAVKAKKPAPDIYKLAVNQLGVPPELCIAIEDSRNGLLAAVAANIPAIITTSEYTVNEDFVEACFVVKSLGDLDGPRATVLANRIGTRIGAFVTLDDLENVIQTFLTKADLHV